MHNLTLVILTEYDEKLKTQQRSYSTLKEKMVNDFDAKILLMKSGMHEDMEEKISFLKRAGEEKNSEKEVMWKAQLVKREKEMQDLQTRFDLLEASSKSAGRVAAEQVMRLVMVV